MNSPRTYFTSLPSKTFCCSFLSRREKPNLGRAGNFSENVTHKSNDFALAIAHIVAREGVARRDDSPGVMGKKRCPHGKAKNRCADCNPCPHGKLKQSCAECNPCPHGKLKQNCAEFNPNDFETEDSAAAPVVAAPVAAAPDAAAPMAAAPVAAAAVAAVPEDDAGVREKLMAPSILNGGLHELVRVRPEDPFEFMREYIKNNSPSETFVWG